MTRREKETYHEIMVTIWRMFTKERTPELYSDAWWQEIIDEYRAYTQKYKGTEFDDYCGELGMVFLNEHERVYKKGRPQRVSQEVLSGSQGFHQEKLQFSDPVREVGGFEEVIEPFT